MRFDSFAHEMLSRSYPSERFDANQTAAFARELEYIFTKTSDILYPELKFRQLIPVNNEVPNGAKSFTYRSYDKAGTGQVVQDYANDFPTAAIIANEFPQRIQSIGASYKYTVQDIRSAAFAGIPLDLKEAEAARRMIESQLDSIACLGNTAAGLPGLANAPNINQYTLAATGTGGSTSWALKSSDAIVQDLNNMATSVFTGSAAVHTVDTLVLDYTSYAYLVNRRTDNSNNQNSVLKYYLEQSPWIKNIDFWPRLALAGFTSGSGYTTPGPRILMYKRDPDVLEFIIPQEFEQMAPEQRAMEFSVACHARTGGVSVRYPKAIVYADGVNG